MFRSIFFLLLCAVPLFAQHEHGSASIASMDEKSCPMHAQHMKQKQPANKKFDAVQHRGEQMEGMGFSQTETTHHFFLTPKGGSIQVTANHSDDAKNIQAIREHMKHIAAAFSAGDFSTPHFVHAEAVPGTGQMKQLGAQISYQAEELPLGARVVITTVSPQALKAVQQFLRYQIQEHRTGDPLN